MSRRLVKVIDLWLLVYSFNSKWPTIPQVYLKGEFIGGCDILMQMHESDEIEKVFGEE